MHNDPGSGRLSHTDETIVWFTHKTTQSEYDGLIIII